MAYLQEKWEQHQHVRRYSSQREFEADWVGALRRRYRLSQEALAALAGVSVTTVQNWENPLSGKRIADHNQTRLRDIERSLWMQAHVTLLEPCPPPIRALYDLMTANRDETAQNLADYLVVCMPADDPERARMLHWAGLAHSMTGQTSEKARYYEEQALQALGSGNDRLAAAIENEILGARFEEVLALPEGRDKRDKARLILEACRRLFERDGQAAYLWNALEVACRAPLDAADRFALVGELEQRLGADRVRRRIDAEAAFARAREDLAAPARLN